MKKGLLMTLAGLVAAFLLFFYWASSTTLSETHYNKLIEYRAKAPAQQKDTFTVMTYNIGYFSGMTNNLPVKSELSLYQENKNKAVQLFRQLTPDFVGFQEIDINSKRSHFMNQLDTLGHHGGYKHGVLGINWDKRYLPFPYWPFSAHYGQMLSAQAILSKYPVKKHDRIVLDKPAANPAYYNVFYIDRLIQVSHLDVNGRDLILMNVHLEAFDQASREQQAQVVLEEYRKYAEKYPVLLIGDFNAGQSIEAGRKESTIELFRKEPGLTMAIADTTFNRQPSRFFTFNSDKPYQKIDYIFYTADQIHALESRVIAEAGQISDHLPVWMKFTFKN